MNITLTVPSPRDLDPERGYCDGMTDALRRLREGRRGAPTDADRPVSVLPLTRAAREARRLDRARRKRAAKSSQDAT